MSGISQVLAQYPCPLFAQGTFTGPYTYARTHTHTHTKILHIQHIECAEKNVQMLPCEGGCSLPPSMMRPSKHGHSLRRPQTTSCGASLHWTRTWVGCKVRTTGGGKWLEWIITLSSSKMQPSQPASAFNLLVDYIYAPSIDNEETASVPKC